VGSITAALAVDAGFEVIAYDRDPCKLRRVHADTVFSRLRLVDEPSALALADVIFVAVRAFVAHDGEADLTPLRDALSSIRALPSAPRLVIVETTVPPGTTRRLVDECFGGSCESLAVAYCPERLRVEDRADQVQGVPRLVGGLDTNGRVLAAALFQRLGVPAMPVSQPEVAELSKLLENLFLTTGIALMGEITRIAHAVGVSAREVAAAAATKPQGYYPFFPGAGIGGHCLVNDMRLLRRAAEERCIRSALLEGIEAAASDLTPTVVRHLEHLLRAHGRALANASVWILGVGFKPGTADTTGSAAIDLVRLLRARSAEVMFSDSRVEAFAVDGLPVTRISSAHPPDRVDAALILAGDPAFELHDVSARAAVALDAGGGRVMRGSNDGLVHL
jgi:nucleotide sugar dehydrogenase